MPELPPKAVVVLEGDDATTHEAAEAAENIGQKILSGGFFRMAAYGFGTVLAIASTAVVSRAVGPEEFAVFTTVLSLMAIASGLTDFGLLALGIREFAAREGEERERKMRALITLRLAFSTLAAIAIVAFGVVSGFSADAMAGVVFAALGVIGLSFYISYCVPLQATYRFNELAALDATRYGLWSGLMILAAVLVGNVAVILASILPVALIVAVATGLIARKATSIVPSWDPSTMRELLAAVGAFAVAASAGGAYSFLAQVASDTVMTAYESGQFGLAFRVFAVLLGAGLTALLGAFPLLVTSARDDLERMLYATRRLMQTALIVGSACAVGLLSGAPVVVAVLGGPEFEDSIEIMAIIGFALPASFMLNAGSTVLLANGRHRELVIVSVVGALISIAITTVLAASYGGTGAAVGIVIGEVILCTGYAVSVARIDRRTLPKLRWVGGMLAATAAGCAVAAIGLPSLLAALLALTVFVVALVGLKLLPPEVTGLLARFT